MLSNGSCQNQDDDEWTNLSDTGPDVEHIDEDKGSSNCDKASAEHIESVEGDKQSDYILFPGEPESTPTVQPPTSYNLRSSNWLNKLQV